VLGNPAIIGFGLQIQSGSWEWVRGGSFKNKDVGWSQNPTTAGDCGGLSPGKTAAITLPCTQPQRYMCE